MWRVGSPVLPNLPAIEDEITRTIGDDGTVLDSASPKLAHLRAEVRIAFNRLQEKLQNMIASTQYDEGRVEPDVERPPRELECIELGGEIVPTRHQRWSDAS